MGKVDAETTSLGSAATDLGPSVTASPGLNRDSDPLRPKWRRISFVAFSLALHAIMIAAILLSSTHRFVAPTSESVVELFDVVRPPETQAAEVSKSTERRRLKAARSSAPRTSSMKLNPSFRPSVPADVAPGLSGDIAVGSARGEGRKGDDPMSEWGSGSKDFSRVEDLGRYDRLYEMIDSRVSYPNVLAANQIQGTVNARLIVSPEGKCLWPRTRISSSQEYLRLYVLDVLQSVCRQSLTRYAKAEGATNLDLSFAFEITEHNEKVLIDAQKKIVGNVFLFYRNSQQSKLQWSIGPFRGMFPIPYVAFDFGWLMENYDRVMHSRDPLKDFKDHLTGESAPSI